MKLSKSIIYLTLLVISKYSYSSNQLGLGDISVVKMNGNTPVLQVHHLFLGKGDRDAYVKFYGCKDTVIEFRITSTVFSEFELRNCEFNNSINKKVSLFFDKHGVREKYNDYEFTKKENHTIIYQTDNHFLLSIRRSDKDKIGEIKFSIESIEGEMSINNINFSILYGNGFTVNKLLDNGSCVRSVLINEKPYNVEYESFNNHRDCSN